MIGCMFVSLCVSIYILGADTQGRAGYPPLAPKPTEVSMATGGVGPGYTDGAAQGGPVVMKKAVTVQSSRPQPAASATMAQQGEDLQHLIIRNPLQCLFAQGSLQAYTKYCNSRCVFLCSLRGLCVVVGPGATDGGAYSSGAAPPEQRAPPAVREERRQPAAYQVPPARQQPPPPEEEEEANDYDSDEASEFTICSLIS